MPGNTLATMITMTTYGTWLRGDQRGWVDDGVIFPADPVLESADRARMKHTPYTFSPLQLYNVGRFIGESLVSRMHAVILALTQQTWHTHFVIGVTPCDVSEIVKCAKDAVRWGLKPGRPVFADGYDKRFCFDADSVRKRVGYVEKHNPRVGLPPRPWDFITDVDEYLSRI